MTRTARRASSARSHRGRRFANQTPVLAEMYLRPVDWSALVLEHLLDREDDRPERACWPTDILCDRHRYCQCGKWGVRRVGGGVGRDTKRVIRVAVLGRHRPGARGIAGHGARAAPWGEGDDPGRCARRSRARIDEGRGTGDAVSLSRSRPRMISRSPSPLPVPNAPSPSASPKECRTPVTTFSMTPSMRRNCGAKTSTCSSMRYTASARASASCSSPWSSGRGAWGCLSERSDIPPRPCRFHTRWGPGSPH